MSLDQKAKKNFADENALDFLGFFDIKNDKRFALVAEMKLILLNSVTAL